MSAVRTFLPLLLPLLALSLSGCSTQSISLLNPPAATVVKPTAVSTLQPPQVLSTGYDQFAGNCPDAVSEDTDLIAYANSQNYNFDMELQIKPTLGCDADPKSPTYTNFLRQVGEANLTMDALDTAWVYGYVYTRDTFLTSVFAHLQEHYPSLAKVTVTVLYGGNTRAILTYNGHGQPQLQDLYAQ